MNSGTFHSRTASSIACLSVCFASCLNGTVGHGVELGSRHFERNTETRIELPEPIDSEEEIALCFDSRQLYVDGDDIRSDPRVQEEDRLRVRVFFRTIDGREIPHQSMLFNGSVCPFAWTRDSSTIVGVRVVADQDVRVRRLFFWTRTPS